MYTVAYMDLDTPNITVDTLSHRRKRFLVNYILFYYYYDSSGLRVELFSSIRAPQAIFFPLGLEEISSHIVSIKEGSVRRRQIFFWD